MFYDFCLTEVLSFCCSNEFMYLRLNRRWERAFRKIHGESYTKVDFTSIARIRYAREMGYFPTRHSIIWSLTFEDVQVFSYLCNEVKLLDGETFINPFVLVMCAADSPAILDFLIEHEMGSIQNTFTLKIRQGYETVEQFREGLEIIRRAVNKCSPMTLLDF